jgi:thiol-disulfide isomerase/thioredoxin
MPARRPFPPVLTSLAVVILTALPLVAAAADRKPAPDFTLTDLNGKVQQLSSYQGKVVVLNFWATWCPECQIEIPSLDAFEKQYGPRGVVVLSVSMDKSESALREFLAGNPVSYVVMMDPTGEVFVHKYFIRGLPATVIIDRHGLISSRMLGAQEFQSKDFTQLIDGLLAEKP